MPGESGVVVKGDRFSKPRIHAPEYGEHRRYSFGSGLPHEPGGKGDAGFSLVQDEHRPHVFADDEVAFPMAGFVSRLNSLGSFMNRGAILDQLARRPGVARTSALVPIW